MLDLYNLIDSPGVDVQYFEGGTPGVAYTAFQSWRKPRGASMVYMLAVGPGGGGGTSNNSGTTCFGASGGGSGAMSVLFVPAPLLPDVLYVQTPPGGAGATANGSNGLASTNTMILIEQAAGSEPSLTLLSAASGGGGGTGTGFTGGGGGGSAPATSIANTVLAGRGYSFFLAGQAGITGGSPAVNAASLTIPTTGLIVTGGTGGGSTNAVGGGNSSGPIVAPATLGTNWFYSVPGAAAASGATPAQNGTPGFKLPNFMMNYGGTGGGGASTTTGGLAGAGGAGAPGCGGGGGGGMGTTNKQVGVGGNGGPGFVLIVSVM